MSQIPDFTIASAVVIDGTHVRIYFTCPLEASDANRDPAKYTFTGAHALTTISCDGSGDYIDAQVNEMAPGINYTAHVTNVRDVFERILVAPKSYTFVGNGDSPIVMTATAVDSRTVRVVFSDDMTNGPVLLDPANYTFTGDYDLVYPCDVVAQSITVISSNTVDVFTSVMVPKAGYFIHVLNVFDWLGNIIIPRLGKKNFPSSFRPMLESTTCYGPPYKVRISFDRLMVNDSALLNPANYIFSGPSIFSGTMVVWIDWHTVDVYYDYENAFGGALYTVTISNAADEVDRQVDPYTPHATLILSGSYVYAEVASAVALNSATVQMVFSRPMYNDAALVDPANYSIIGPAPVSVTSVTRINSTTVNITVVGEMRNGVAYVAAVGNVLDANSVPLLAGHNTATFTGVGARPRVSLATAQDIDTIRLVFNEAMANNAALINTANYVFSGPTVLTTALVTRINATIVDVDVTGEMRTSGNYTITVANVTDLAGNVIDPLHDEATFSGIGIAPRVSSATVIDATHIDVLFDEDMLNDAALTTTTNYVISGAGSPAVSTVVRQSATVVRLTIPFVAGGNYTVTVSNVKDLAGNVIDPAHNSANFVVASLGKNMYIFGGFYYSGGVNLDRYDIWRWAGSDWTEVTPGVPPTLSPTARAGSAMTYSSGSTRFVLFGGHSTTYQADTWEWNGTAWTKKTTIDFPPSNSYAALAYYPPRNRVTLFGGYNGFYYPPGTWEYEIATRKWIEQFPATSPSQRVYNNMVYDSANTRIVMFGGRSSAWAYLNDLWSWNGTNWTDITPVVSPVGRLGHAMTYDSSRGVILVFGGYQSPGHPHFLQDMWEFDGTTWTEVTPGGAKPTNRSYMRMEYDSTSDKVILFGGVYSDGFGGTTYYNDTWEWNCATRTWAQLFPAHSPPVRAEHVMAID